MSLDHFHVEHAMTAINTAASIWVLWSSICAANFMSLKTPALVRVAYILLGVGAAASLMAPGYLQRPPTLAELLLVCGMALLTVANRRRRPFTAKPA